jgi:hypothetical protein
VVVVVVDVEVIRKAAIDAEEHSCCFLLWAMGTLRTCVTHHHRPRFPVMLLQRRVS